MASELLEEDDDWDDDSDNDDEGCESNWLCAPQSQDVLQRVLMLVAGQLKRMAERQLASGDHARRMKLLIAAGCYQDCLHQVHGGHHLPPAAWAVAELHLRFARQAMCAVTIGGRAAEADLAVLESVADECFAARGAICDQCGLPTCFHRFSGRLAGLNHRVPNWRAN